MKPKGYKPNYTQLERTVRKLPGFASEDEEREFWAKHDSTDFLEGAKEVEYTRMATIRRKRYPKKIPKKLRKPEG